MREVVQRVLARAHLTATGGAALVGAVACWFLARWLDSRALFLLVYLAALSMIVAAAVSRRRLQVELTRSQVSPRMREGQIASVELVVRAQRRVSTVVIEDELDPVLGATVHIPVATLAPGDELRHRYTFTPTRRGVYRVGPARATWSDPFGLTAQEQDLSDATEVIVHPATESVHDRVLARMWEDPPIRPPVSKRWPTGFEFYGMRDYVPGDDLRRIVWSAVAKTDRILVRESEQGITDRVVIFFDTAVASHSPGDPSDTFETAVRAAASLGVRHLGDGLTVTFVTNDGTQCANLRGAGANVTLLDTLARLEPSDRPFGAVSADIIGSGRSGAHMTVLTPHLENDVVGSLRLGLERGASVTIAAIVWEETSPQLLARAASLGCQVVQIPANASLESVFAHQIGAGIR